MATSPVPALDSDAAPKYWRNETGGRLRMAVEHYLTGGPVTLHDVAYIRAYLIQWIDSPAWDQNPMHDDASRAQLRDLRAGARLINDSHDLRVWLSAAERAGMDPL